jgi:hypothetical protein
MIRLDVSKNHSDLSKLKSGLKSAISARVCVLILRFSNSMIQQFVVFITLFLFIPVIFILMAWTNKIPYIRKEQDADLQIVRIE